MQSNPKILNIIILNTLINVDILNTVGIIEFQTTFPKISLVDFVTEFKSNLMNFIYKVHLKTTAVTKVLYRYNNDTQIYNNIKCTEI